jgi:GDP-D-mannose dehydratase
VDNKNFILHYGDLSDSTNLIRIIQEVQPDEIYNLGAMSHVRVSFEVPEYVADTDGIGTLRLLEAIRILGLTQKTKIYQASTSELFGLVQETPQKETTPFYPRSPYGVAKLYAYWITVNYREAYNMFACNGVLFNHETICFNMPMIYKQNVNGFINIKPIAEIVKHHTNKNKVSIDTSKLEYQETMVSENLYVWDAKGWTKVLYASAYPHQKDIDNKQPRFLIAKNAAYMATGSHVCIMNDGSEKEFKDIEIGDKVNLIDYPTVATENFGILEEEAKLLGFIVGDGSVKEGRQLQLTSKNKEALEPFVKIWESLHPENKSSYWQTKSGFNSEQMIWQVRLTNAASFLKKYCFYDENHKKCVPFQILNSDKAIQLAFLKGYNDADGLKANSCKYEFKNFKTNSATLAAGLIFLLKQTTNQDYNINIETTDKWGVDSIYYSINVLSDSELAQNHRNSIEKKEKVLELVEEGISQRGIERETGISRTFIRKVQHGYDVPEHHPRLKPNDEVKKIIEMPNYEGWFYDLTTESGTFHCGIGQGHVHNSPLRGETFVTRKITRGVAKIALGMQDKLFMGNLNSKRDWGHAKDFVEGMWMMLQQEKPEDFILATGVTTEIREFIRMAFAEVGIELKFKGHGVDEVATVKKCHHPDYQLPIGKEVVAIDPRYFRPTEVDLLLGDPTKAKTKLGWKPKYDVKMLCAEMVAADVELFKREKLLKDAGFEVKNQYE